MQNNTEKRIVIVGGGFAGIAAALHFAKLNLSNIKVVLVSEKPHFEYHAALYRLVTGSSPLEVCYHSVKYLREKRSRSSKTASVK